MPNNMKDRQKILEITADANKELARATEYAVTVNEKGLCGEEAMLEDHLLGARQRIDQALGELQGAGSRVENDAE